MTVTKLMEWEYDEGWQGKTYTDEETLASTSVVEQLCIATGSGFRRADTLFGKYKLKSRMNKLGFSKFS